MTPKSILARAESLGLKLVLDGDQIRGRGPHEAVQEIAPLVKQAKPELLAFLKVAGNGHQAAPSGLSGCGPYRGSQSGHSEASSQPIPADLETLIQESARFWQWDEDDLRLISETASRDPDGIRLALSTDPLRHLYRTGTVNDTRLGSKA